eukprot:768745-Hanusia_phi.AAC.8
METRGFTRQLPTRQRTNKFENEEQGEEAVGMRGDGGGGGALMPLSPNHGLTEMSLKGKGRGEGARAGDENQPPSLMRAPKPAAQMLKKMMSEVMCARGWLKEVSAGSAGSNGPYFSPCRVKGGRDIDVVKNHSIPSEEYENLLAQPLGLKKNEPAKQAAYEKTMLRKFRQATQELLAKRNKVVERLCKVDDEFAIREKAYKDQVSSLTSQLKKERSQEEKLRVAKEGAMADIQTLVADRDDLASRLEEACRQITEEQEMFANEKKESVAKV